MANREEFKEFAAKMNANSSIKKVIAVMSGKGGVGKSLVTGLLAVQAQRKGRKVAIMDADITGPSIPTMFGLHEQVFASETEMFPAETKTGIKAISLNLLNVDPAAPVVWRGPVVAGLIKQFWSDVAWGDVDEMYVDMPPGTGDVPLTVFQSLPVSAIVVVTTPQDLVSLIVEKAVRMAQMMNVPILAIVENMSYIKCPHCLEKIYPYGKSDLSIKDKYGIPLSAQLPIDPQIASKVDAGEIESFEGDYLSEISEKIALLPSNDEE
jgi:Mrp family chromosome partitioning ATPase